ncbi:MAG: phospho-sugar mutase [Eubacteriales bacterium]|nr:phospho-sugar mutase [Eubacteriales bacterium]
MFDIHEKYNQWLALGQEDSALARELEIIRDDPKAIEDRFYRDLAFGTAGMRGILGAGPNRMNRFTVRRAAAGLADYLRLDAGMPFGPVAIAYDSRHQSDVFAKETALMLAARGVKALLFDALRPVPVLSFAVRHLDAAAGVVITASHNPPEYNGFKAYGPDGAQLSPEAAEGMTQRMDALSYGELKPMPEDQALEKGLLCYIGEDNVDAAYTRMALSLQVRPDIVNKLGGSLKIVYTPLHGTGNLPVRRVLKEAGFSQITVVPEQELPDPDFPTVKAPNPEDPGAFAMAVPLAKQTGATVIIGTDPDCDRLGVCVRDSGGEFRTLSGNQIGCLMLHHILSQRRAAGTLPKNGACVKSVVSTGLANVICEDYGVKMFDVLTGFKFIGEKIQEFEETGEHTFLFGFEESFGYLSSTQVRDKDAVNAALLVAEAACVCLSEGATLYDRLQQIYQEYGYFAESVVSNTYPGKEGAERMAAIMAALREDPPAEIAGTRVLALRDYLAGARTQGDHKEPLGTPPSDVLYFELAGGRWLCARPSGTEPKIKFYAGASHKESMEKAQEAADQLMAGIRALAE